MITLYAARLGFVILGTGKVHAKDSRWPSVTCCGRDMRTVIGVVAVAERSQRIEHMCGRCVKSLHTYTGGQVVFEKE